MSDIEADISLLISRLSAMATGLEVVCKNKVGFCNDGFCFSNDCIGLYGFFVVGGLNEVDCTIVNFVVVSGLTVVYFGVDLVISVVVVNCVFVDDDDGSLTVVDGG